MVERLIVISVESGHTDTIIALARQIKVLDFQVYPPDEETRRQTVHVLIDQENRQALLDRLQSCLGAAEDWRITILPVEATLPPPEKDAEKEANGRKGAKRQSREELYNDVATSARIDWNFLIFVVLSTVVAAIGLIEDNVAVVIGAMVIAPLLGPNLAFSLGVALGDRGLMGRAMVTNALGVALSVALCVLIGLTWPLDLRSEELMARTRVGFDGLVLALAAGAAAALSRTTGVSSALVGVMVAVALLPPAAAIGLMLGAGHRELAVGAALLLAINVVCVNLSAQIVFVLRGVTPRTWFEKKAAQRAVLINAGVWFLLLLALVGLLVLRRPQLS
jgi:uncharacterized hydrophobic protein (TIGR00341 family)